MDRIPDHIDLDPQETQDVFYHLTVGNEKTAHPAMPAGAGEGIVRGMYLLREANVVGHKPRVQLLGSGAILKEVIAAADLLQHDFDVIADIWSVTSYTELRREWLEIERWNRLHPTEAQRTSFVQRQLTNTAGPVIAATDCMKAVPDQISGFMPAKRRFVTLGTEGFGRSDTREALRKHFEVDRHHVAVAALKALADDGLLPAQEVARAIAKYGIDTEARSAALG